MCQIVRRWLRCLSAPSRRCGSMGKRCLDRLAHMIDWLVREGRFSHGNAELTQRFCEQLVAQGVKLSRCYLYIRTLHPNFAGMIRLWEPEATVISRPLPYGFEDSPDYLNSPVRHAIEHAGFHYWPIEPERPAEFPTLEDLRPYGHTGYAITRLIFSDGEVNVISWATREAGGFAAEYLALLEALMPTLSAIVEINSLRRFASNLLTTYVGHEPGELILKGQVRRGDVRTTTAALMLVDLRGFSELSDTHSPALVIETLNRYFDCVIPPVLSRGGEVMEIMGDGILAMFNENGTRDSREVCRLALDAAREGLSALTRSNLARSNADAALIELHAGIALHHGQASYGNIGAGDRLDFTVIGPDVNLTSRIERICRDIGRDLIMSADFATLLDEPGFEIGHFDLRGFARKQLLIGLLDPAGG